MLEKSFSSPTISYAYENVFLSVPAYISFLFFLMPAYARARYGIEELNGKNIIHFYKKTKCGLQNRFLVWIN